VVAKNALAGNDADSKGGDKERKDDDVSPMVEGFDCIAGDGENENASQDTV